MRRFISFLAALALVALMAAPVFADGSLTIRSATVDRAGLVTLSGTVVCPPEMSGQQFDIGGDVTQTFGHKFIVSGQINASGTCFADGPLTNWTVTLTANSNKFSTGPAVVNLNMQGGGGCVVQNDPSTCYPGVNAGAQLIVKITRK
jgi:hypothetical protein